MEKYKIGDGVSVITGPLQGIYGVIVWFNNEDSTYLIRFTGQQQLYYTENEIKYWE